MKRTTGETFIGADKVACGFFALSAIAKYRI